MKTFVGLLSRDTASPGPWLLKTESCTYALLGEQPPSLNGALVQVAGFLLANPSPAPGTQGAIDVRGIRRFQNGQP